MKVKNSGSALAFMIMLSIVDEKTGEGIFPTYWDDNYFCLLPGEKKDIKARFAKDELRKAVPIVKVDGWNIE